MNKPIPRLTDADVARFWNKVDKSSDCWLWVAHTNNRGYGQFGIGDSLYLAHRISYTIASGDPGGLNVNHTCDTPSCVNPTHLWTGTQQDGMNDMIAKSRHCHGSQHDKAKLTENQVEEILASEEFHQTLADCYGVALGTISKIKRGEKWRHVKGKRSLGANTNKTGTRGVSLDKASGKYRARIVIKGKRCQLGMFTSIEDAMKAVAKHRKKNP